MPFVSVHTNVPTDAAKAKEFLKILSKKSSETMDKPEERFMVAYNHENTVFGSSDQPAAFVRFNSIGGLDAKMNATLSAMIA